MSATVFKKMPDWPSSEKPIPQFTYQAPVGTEYLRMIVLDAHAKQLQGMRYLPRPKAEHASGRLEAVRACSFVHSAQAIEVALDALNHETDEYLEYPLSDCTGRKLRATDFWLMLAGDSSLISWLFFFALETDDSTLLLSVLWK